MRLLLLLITMTVFLGSPAVAGAAWTSVDGGARHSCAVRTDGSLACWGDGRAGQTAVPAGLGSVTAVSTGSAFTCAIRTSGVPACWGANGSGQISIPPGLGGLTAISAGSAHACAIRSDGGLVCWGANGFGQRTIPAALGSVTAVTAGDRHTCAIKADGTPACWGDGSWGQSTVPIGTGAVKAITAGQLHTCAIKLDGTPVCWGDNNWHQLDLPAAIGTVTAIAAGDVHTCAIETDGTPVCWGLDADVTSVPSWVGDVTAIAAGSQHSCAVRGDATLACWGSNADGQRGPQNVAAPVITGMMRVGATLSATPGTWLPEVDAYHYQWQRCEDSCTNVGEDLNSYRLVHEDGHRSMRVVVTAVHRSGSATSFSERTPLIQTLAPGPVEPPGISGVPLVGETLTASDGVWSPEADSYAYQWRRCERFSQACAAIAGANARTYVLDAADHGRRMQVLVTATNAYGSWSQTSRLTELVDRPFATVTPRIVGAAYVGATLTADPGTWLPAGDAVTYGYRWWTCPRNGEGCRGLATNTQRTYVVTANDVGHLIQLEVTATNSVGPTTSKVLTGRVFGAPIATVPPVITGAALVGTTLQATSGDWTPPDAPIAYAYQWLHCDADGGACTAVGSAGTSTSYALTAADVGARIRVRVSATLGGRTATSSSAATQRVWTVAPTAPPVISGGRGVGDTLTTTNGSWTGTPVSFHYQWLRCDGAGGACVNVGADANHYMTVTADGGSRMRVRVTADGASSGSAATPPVGVPFATTPPGIGGTTTRSATLGTWSPAGTAYHYAWLRCDVDGTACVTVGSDQSTYVVTAADVGHRLRVRVSATNGYGSATSTSAATPRISAASPSASSS